MLEEIYIFLIFFIFGAVVAAVFFLGGFFTSKIKKIKRLVFVESFLLTTLFCIVFVIFFLLVLFLNFGAFRIYMFAGFALGLWISFKITKFVALFVQKAYNKARWKKLI